MSPEAALRLFTMKATTSPIHKDIVKITVTVETPPFIPANIIEVDAYVAAAEQNGQEVVDYDMQATKAMELGEITERVNSLKSTWKAQAMVTFGDVKDVETHLSTAMIGEDLREHGAPPRGDIFVQLSCVAVVITYG